MGGGGVCAAAARTRTGLSAAMRERWLNFMCFSFLRRMRSNRLATLASPCICNKPFKKRNQLTTGAGGDVYAERSPGEGKANIPSALPGSWSAKYLKACELV